MIFLAGNGNLLFGKKKNPQGDENFLPIVKEKRQTNLQLGVVSFSFPILKT